MALPRTIRWRPWSGEGLEHLYVAEKEGSIEIRGVCIADADNMRFGYAYLITLDRDWGFRGLSLTDADFTGPSHLLLRRLDDGSWISPDREAYAELAGCIDIDVVTTPLTNTLPIRRLGLRQGDAREISVAYLEPPFTQPRRVTQRYTCLEADRRYRFESLDTGFSAELEVDEDGLVLDYPGLFRRVPD